MKDLHSLPAVLTILTVLMLCGSAWAAEGETPFSMSPDDHGVVFKTPGRPDRVPLHDQEAGRHEADGQQRVLPVSGQDARRARRSSISPPAIIRTTAASS